LPKRNTTKKQISEYWSHNSKIPETDLNFDWSDSFDCCWNCGIFTKHTERCHIIPIALNGEDKPHNYVLLCKRCHGEAPNIHCKNAMWDWILKNKKKYSCFSYNVSNVIEQLEREYNINFFNVDNVDEFIKKLKHELENISTHSFYVTESTYYYMLKKVRGLT